MANKISHLENARRQALVIIEQKEQSIKNQKRKLKETEKLLKDEQEKGDGFKGTKTIDFQILFNIDIS